MKATFCIPCRSGKTASYLNPPLFGYRCFSTCEIVKEILERGAVAFSLSFPNSLHPSLSCPIFKDASPPRIGGMVPDVSTVEVQVKKYIFHKLKQLQAKEQSSTLGVISFLARRHVTNDFGVEHFQICGRT